jgi:hypothetical protein
VPYVAGMDEQQPPVRDPLPSHVRWFAVWRWLPTWKPWQRWTLVVSGLLVGYVLSPIPVLWTAERLGGRGVRDQMVWIAYAPIVALCEWWPALDHEFYTVQDDWLRKAIGDP